MFCPNCQSSAVYGPSVRNEAQAVMRCGDCARTFDAYAMYGTNSLATRVRRAA